MAEKTTDQQPESGCVEFTEADKKKARAWFKKAADTRERRDYDYAIECFITGLSFWPEAVEEGHMPLWSLAVQRRQAGGKKPTMMDGLRRSMTGKDAHKAMLNAEYLMAKDPTSSSYIDGLMKNAAKAGYFETLKWIAQKGLDSLRKDKKPNLGRFKVFRQTLTEAGDKASDARATQLAAYFYEQAVNSLEYLVARNPSDGKLRDEQREMSGKLTIARGKYEGDGSFRDSIQDADAQKILHDTERVKQGDQTVDNLIAAARAAYEEDPTTPNTILAYVDTLLRRDREDEEDAAISVLDEAFKSTDNYSWKMRADDIRMRQLQRRTRRMLAKARESGSAEDKQQARLTASEQITAETEIFRERVAKYPTDLRMKFKLGRVLFTARRFDEAIPLLQEAQGEPRSREQAQLLIGRCFHENEAYSQAREVLKDALERREQNSDDLGKELLYWLARAHEANADTDAAKEAYGKLLRMDYNYANGDARKRLEALG